MEAHSSILAWRIPWTEEPGGYSPWGRRELDTTEMTVLMHACTFPLLSPDFGVWKVKQPCWEREGSQSKQLD